MAESSRISKRRAAALSDGGVEYTAKRNDLIRVAATLFKEKGYRSTTLNDIAKAAGLDRATVYYYIGGKEEFFREAVKGILGDNLAEAEHLVRLKKAKPREKLERLVEMLMTSYDNNYPYAYVYIQQDMHKVADIATPWAKQMARQTHRFEKAVLALIQEGMEQKAFRKDITPELAANAIFGMLNWTNRWHRPGGKNSAKEIAQAFSKIFFEGIESK
jgi:TetR/AcrR family transcriptional regulator, cholesterol catabolism regulator